MTESDDPWVGGAEAIIEKDGIFLRLFGAWGNMPCHLSIQQARMVRQELINVLDDYDARERDLDNEYGPRISHTTHGWKPTAN